jgi:hypothetical protein
MEELERLKEQVEKCTIRAPEAGQVVYANETDRRGRETIIIEEGTQVRENQVLIRLPDPKRMEVEAKINEAKVTQVEAGMTATIRLDAFPDLRLPGTVEEVNEYPEPTSWFMGTNKEYGTTVTIDEAPPGLRPGLTAEVRILVERQNDVLMLPVLAVFQHGRKFYCIVPTEQGLQPREVKLGSSNDKVVIILEGVKEGDKVVMNAGAVRDEVELPEIKQPAAEETPARPSGPRPNRAQGQPGQSDGPEPSAGSSKPPTPGSGQRPGGDTDRFKQLDRNGDGKLQKDELPSPMRPMFDKADTNSDGAITRDELKAVIEKMRGGG